MIQDISARCWMMETGAPPVGRGKGWSEASVSLAREIIFRSRHRYAVSLLGQGCWAKLSQFVVSVPLEDQYPKLFISQTIIVSFWSQGSANSFKTKATELRNSRWLIPWCDESRCSPLISPAVSAHIFYFTCPPLASWISGSLMTVVGWNYLYIYFSHKKEWNSDRCYHMDETLKTYAQ